MENEIMQLDKIHHGNCMEYLADIDDESMDMVVLDPNYQDWDKMCEEGLICQAVRVLKPTGNIICFTKQPFDFNLRNEINYMFRREFSWTFDNGGAWVSNKMPLVSFQKIYWCTPNEKQFYFNPRTGLDYSAATKNFKRKNKVFGGYNGEGRKFEKSDEGIWIRDHFHYNKPQMGSIPAKPLELLRIFVHCMCPEGGVVLDPFMGSAQTAIACLKEKRHFIGFELDDECYKLANERVKFEITQPTLF